MHYINIISKLYDEHKNSSIVTTVL